MNVLPLGTKVQDIDYDNPTTGEVAGHTLIGGTNFAYIVKLDNPGYMEGRQNFISVLVMSADNVVEVNKGW
jgi:hypothetical protein